MVVLQAEESSSAMLETFYMKISAQTLIILACTFAASSSLAQTVEETYLLCEGKMKNVLYGNVTNGVVPLTIVKVDGKITSVATNRQKFTLDRVDVSTQEHKGPVYVQLIVGEEKITLRMEVTETSKIADIVLQNSGQYTEQRMYGIFSGRCAPGKKVF